MSINDSMYYYIKNLQGDITKIVNHQGKVMVEYTYDAWGNILKEKSNVTPSYATVKEFNPFRYRGYVYDTDTGLYYLQSRYYDPKTGRFINADDTAYVDTNSGTPLSTNMFAYCENNPINKQDKNGNMAAAATVAVVNWWNPIGWIVGGIVIIVSVCLIYNCISLGVKNGKAVPQLSKRKKTKIPSKLKKGNKVKTPDKYKDEFVYKKDGIFEHKKTKWKCGKSKDGHFNNKEHWHYSPKNGKTGDYYNVSPEGKVL